MWQDVTMDTCSHLPQGRPRLSNNPNPNPNPLPVGLALMAEGISDRGPPRTERGAKAVSGTEDGTGLGGA